MVMAIAHTTDFSAASAVAFAHALRLALHFKCRLELLHVKRKGDSEDWGAFPHVRETLHQWGLLPASATHADILTKLNLAVRKAEVTHDDIVEGVAAYMQEHACGLLVVATHGREGFNRWLQGSVSEAIARRTRVPALFIGHNARPFVDPAKGSLTLKSILLPIAHEPRAAGALESLNALFGSLQPQWHAVHAGDTPPALMMRNGQMLAVDCFKGSAVEAILKAAETHHADLIAMPTAGRHGFLDAIRGSTTERVIHQSTIPVLAIPA